MTWEEALGQGDVDAAMAAVRPGVSPAWSQVSYLHQVEAAQRAILHTVGDSSVGAMVAWLGEPFMSNPPNWWCSIYADSHTLGEDAAWFDEPDITWDDDVLMLDPGLATGHPGFESDADGLWFELCFYQLFQHAVLSLRQPGAAVGNAALLGQRGGSGEKICLLAPLGMDFATYRLQLEQVWATPARPRKKQPRPSRMVLDFKAHLQQALALEREGDAESAWTLVSDFVPADADLAHQRYLLELRMLVRRGNTEGAAWGLERLPLAERTELLRQYSILRPLIGLESESVPEGAELATAFGIAALRRRDVRAALLHFDEALRLDPSYGPAYRNRGLGAALGGDLQAALFDLDEAVARDPGDALVRYNRSKVFRRLGWYAEAADDLEAARRLDPSLS